MSTAENINCNQEKEKREKEDDVLHSFYGGDSPEWWEWIDMGGEG